MKLGCRIIAASSSLMEGSDVLCLQMEKWLTFFIIIVQPFLFVNNILNSFEEVIFFIDIRKKQ